MRPTRRWVPTSLYPNLLPVVYMLDAAEACALILMALAEDWRKSAAPTCVCLAQDGYACTAAAAPVSPFPDTLFDSRPYPPVVHP